MFTMVGFTLKRCSKRRNSLQFYLFIIVIITFTAAMIVRVYDAYLQGDVWLAFSRRSDVGYPIAHILGLIALATLLYAKFGLKRGKIENGGPAGIRTQDLRLRRPAS